MLSILEEHTEFLVITKIYSFIAASLSTISWGYNSVPRGNQSQCSDLFDKIEQIVPPTKLQTIEIVETSSPEAGFSHKPPAGHTSPPSAAVAPGSAALAPVPSGSRLLAARPWRRS